MAAQPECRAHAPDLLRDLFNELTEARVHFEKTDHSVRLTEWLLENDAERLAEISSLLVEVLEGKGIAAVI